VVGSLPHESLRQVADIVEAPPAETPYVAIKQRLMAAHQMTSFQRAEKLFAMPALGNRKPSELMAAICPRGEEKTDLFTCLFLQQLPREIRILLADADHKDPKLLAEKADQLWPLCEVITAAAGEEAAAVVAEATTAAAEAPAAV
jgi:hypothetical protein